jgi:ferredoxin
MRVLVDLNRCQAYAQCAFLAPDVFVLHGSSESLLYNPQPDENQRQQILRAVHACPVQAIMVEFDVNENIESRPRVSEKNDPETITTGQAK